MNKKQQKLIVAALLAFIISVYAYQVSYGLSFIPDKHAATNASYEWGFKNGKDEWDSCSDADGDCQTGLTDCSTISYSVYNYTTGYSSPVPNTA